MSDKAAALKRSQILAGAARAFAADGYAGASMSRVAREAGVSKGTLYNHFVDKADLFAAWVSDELARELAHIFDGAERDQDAATALREIGHRMVQMCLSDTAVTIERVVVSEAHAFPNLARAYYQAGPGPGIARMAGFLRRAAQLGTLDVPDAEFAAEQFYHLCQAGLTMHVKLRLIEGPTAEMIERTVDGAVKMFLASYGRGRPMQHQPC